MKNTIEDIVSWLRLAKPEWIVKEDLYKSTMLVSTENRKLVTGLVKEELQELIDAFNVNDPKEILDAVVDIVWVALNSAALVGFSKEMILKAFEEVSRSNWSKFCKTEEEAFVTVQAYRNGTHPDKPEQKIDVYSKKIGDHYIILRKVDNKIMKSYRYIPADISSIVNKN